MYCYDCKENKLSSIHISKYVSLRNVALEDVLRAGLAIGHEFDERFPKSLIRRNDRIGATVVINDRQAKQHVVCSMSFPIKRIFQFFDYYNFDERDVQDTIRDLVDLLIYLQKVFALTTVSYCATRPRYDGVSEQNYILHVKSSVLDVLYAVEHQFVYKIQSQFSKYPGYDRHIIDSENKRWFLKFILSADGSRDLYDCADKLLKCPVTELPDTSYKINTHQGL